LAIIFLPTLPSTILATLSAFFRYPISLYHLVYYGVTTTGLVEQLSKKGDYNSALLTFGAGCLGLVYWPRALVDPERRKQIDDNAKYLCNFLRYSSLPVYTAEDAKKIITPTLVVTGANGLYFQQCIDVELIKICGAEKKREVKIEGAGHLTHEDNPEGVFKAVLAFMKDGSVAS
jgi:pimeloyl-ACP methyl ester carboxylesterase